MTRTDGIITIFDMERMLLPPFSSLLWEESRDFNSDIEDEARHLSKIESSDSFTQTWFFFSTLRKYFRIQDDDAFWLAYETNQSTKMKSENQFLRRHKTREKRAKFSSIFETFKRGGGVQKFETDWHFWGAEDASLPKILLTPPEQVSKAWVSKMRKRQKYNSLLHRSWPSFPALKYSQKVGRQKGGMNFRK